MRSQKRCSGGSVRSGSSSMLSSRFALRPTTRCVCVAAGFAVVVATGTAASPQRWCCRSTCVVADVRVGRCQWAMSMDSTPGAQRPANGCSCMASKAQRHHSSAQPAQDHRCGTHQCGKQPRDEALLMTECRWHVFGGEQCGACRRARRAGRQLRSFLFKDTPHSLHGSKMSRLLWHRSSWQPTNSGNCSRTHHISSCFDPVKGASTV